MRCHRIDYLTQDIIDGDEPYRYKLLYKNLRTLSTLTMVESLKLWQAKRGSNGHTYKIAKPNDTTKRDNDKQQLEEHMGNTRKFGVTTTSLEFRYSYNLHNVFYDCYLPEHIHMQRNCPERVRNSRCCIQCFNGGNLGYLNRDCQMPRMDYRFPTPKIQETMQNLRQLPDARTSL